MSIALRPAPVRPPCERNDRGWLDAAALVLRGRATRLADRHRVSSVQRGGGASEPPLPPGGGRDPAPPHPPPLHHTPHANKMVFPLQRGFARASCGWRRAAWGGSDTWGGPSRRSTSPFRPSPARSPPPTHRKAQQTAGGCLGRSKKLTQASRGKPGGLFDCLRLVPAVRVEGGRRLGGVLVRHPGKFLRRLSAAFSRLDFCSSSAQQMCSTSQLTPRSRLPVLPTANCTFCTINVTQCCGTGWPRPW